MSYASNEYTEFHRLAAEGLLAKANEPPANTNSADQLVLLAAAQVHATLATVLPLVMLAEPHLEPDPHAGPITFTTDDGAPS